ncbi:hypothetical protein ACHAXA_002588 [Cyclostephanos tholiformis]|uniref:Uncharacterized protein n=1 Tax=Cyclostephanos tholiformis TaxID=382380 RepID=A0ABD3R691_9STRA
MASGVDSLLGGLLPGSGTSPPPTPPSSSDKSKKPKRVRRKCSHPSCDNRVVQGGVCVTHGARRKCCAHPGCDKAVKLAGFCSTHGPSRRKCDEDGCDRVAVQGGRCLSHGARRRVCNYPSRDGMKCGKNAIVGGMCKKHHDRMADARGMLDAVGLCVPCNVASDGGVQVVGTDLVYSGEDSVGGGGGEEVGGGQGSPSTSSGQAPKAYPSRKGGDQSAIVAGAFPPVEASVDGRYDGYYQPVDQHWNSHEQYHYPHQDPKTFQDHQDPAAFVGYPHYTAVGDGCEGYYRQSLPPPPQPTESRPPKRARHQKPPGHLRGLSIFEDMSTVDAIISSGKSENRHSSSSLSSNRPPQSDRRRDIPPPSSEAHYRPQETSSATSQVCERATSMLSFAASSSSNYNDAMSATKTPAAQVSFADSCFPRRDGRRPFNASSSNPRGEPRHSPGGSGRNGVDSSPPCTGNSSCTCTACRSPTLAIFEQMIQASQKIEKGEVDTAKYAGLSPPRLSPRRAIKAAAAVSAERPDQNLGPDPPIATGGTVVVGGSVIRKVSNNNIVGEAGGIPPQQDGGCHTQDHHGSNHRPVYPWETVKGPASQALAAASPSHGEEEEASGVGRTISNDVDDSGMGGGRYHHSQHDAMSLSLHPRHHPTLLQDFQPPPAHLPSSLPHAHDPTQGAPLTPKLYDGNDHPKRGAAGSPQPRDASDPAMVSSHSSNSSSSLLPRRRECIEHLFIPKEV